MCGGGGRQAAECERAGASIMLVKQVLSQFFPLVMMKGLSKRVGMPILNLLHVPTA